MKKVIIFSLNDADPTDLNFQENTKFPNNDLLARGLIVGKVVPKSGLFTSRTGTTALPKARHLRM